MKVQIDGVDYFGSTDAEVCKITGFGSYLEPTGEKRFFIQFDKLTTSDYGRQILSIGDSVHLRKIVKE